MWGWRDTVGWDFMTFGPWDSIYGAWPFALSYPLTHKGRKILTLMSFCVCVCEEEREGERDKGRGGGHEGHSGHLFCSHGHTHSHTHTHKYQLWHMQLTSHKRFGMLHNFLTPWNAIIHKPGERKELPSVFIQGVHLSYTQHLIFPEPV